MGVRDARPVDGSRGTRSRNAAYIAFIEPYVRTLVLLGCVALFLQSAGTVQFVYTVRLSFVLLALATAIGLPLAWGGWVSLPKPIRWSAVAVVAVYVTAGLTSTGTTLALARAGPQREFMYLADLAVGLGSFGLLVAICRRPRHERQVLRALVLAGALAGLYGSYQWLAQKFGWPLSDVLSVGDSNGLTTGASQGTGLFGFERVRGTFLEPHFLGAFLASSLPLAAALWFAERDRRVRRWVVASIGAMSAALLFTASAPAWATLALCVLAGVVTTFVLYGRRLPAATAAALFVAALIATVVTLQYPGVLAGLTGRSGADLALTSSFRTDAWDASVDVWAQRPVLGYGPGQSAVQLTAQAAVADAAPGLVSPQGLWAAVLIDIGILGLGCWVLLIGGVLLYSVAGLLRDPRIVGVAIFVAAFAAIVSGLLAGDRFELRAWLLVALLVSVSTRTTHQRRSAAGPNGAGGRQPDTPLSLPTRRTDPPRRRPKPTEGSGTT